MIEFLHCSLLWSIFGPTSRKRTKSVPAHFRKQISLFFLYIWSGGLLSLPLLDKEKCNWSLCVSSHTSIEEPPLMVGFESVPMNAEYSTFRIPRAKCDKRRYKHFSHTGVARVSDIPP